MPVIDPAPSGATCTPLVDVPFVVIDVETTGGAPGPASLTEIAAARYQGGCLLATFDTLVRPDDPIPPFITSLTGIDDAMVAHAPRADAVLPAFLQFVAGTVIVGHNVRFDVGFLNHALDAAGYPPLGNLSVDTLVLARRLVRDQVPNCRLGTLAAALDLAHVPSHRALTDVLATGDLLHALVERAGPYGIVELDELLNLPRLVGHPQAGKLRLTNGLPHQPGAYWFTDARGELLHAGLAPDLRSHVRSYFSIDRRPKAGQLLRRLHAVHHRPCSDLEDAARVRDLLVGSWRVPGAQPVPTGTTASAVRT